MCRANFFVGCAAFHNPLREHLVERFRIARVFNEASYVVTDVRSLSFFYGPLRFFERAIRKTDRNLFGHTDDIPQRRLANYDFYCPEPTVREGRK